MNWYYVDAGAQAGPVEDAQLEELVRSGKIQPDTLVWHDGMPNWLPFREANPSAAAAPPPPQPAGLRIAGTAAATAPLGSHGVEEVVCDECHGIFNKQDTVTIGGVRVCANCKPVLMQKMAEGAHVGGALNFAGIGTRFGAVFLDGIILGVVNFLMGLVVGGSVSQAAGITPQSQIGMQFVLLFVQILIGMTYEVVMIGKYGATLGKMAAKIHVVTADGGKVGYGRAFGRYFAKMLSGLICLIGYIMAFFDDEKRALHDRICDTRVVMNG
jgi:uncharacterized RDD family membrane protein YckC